MKSMTDAWRRRLKDARGRDEMFASIEDEARTVAHEAQLEREQAARLELDADRIEQMAEEMRRENDDGDDGDAGVLVVV